jgi:CRP-like cAMP-binding protein
MEPHLYTASAWTTEQSELYVVNGIRLRQLCESNKHIGYQVARGIGEVISRRFGQVVGGRGGHALAGRGIDELHQFKIFSELDLADLEAITKISQVKLFDTGAELTVEGAPAECLYLFLNGRATVKVRSADGSQHVIDELGAGEMLGWGAVMEPHRYTASAWTTEPTEAIVIKGADLRALCDRDKRMGYLVVKGIGEVMSKRFGQALGGRGFDELHHFKIFSALDVADLDAVARICHIREVPAGEELTVEGASAERLYLFSRGKAIVKVRSPEGGQVVIDELGRGDILGWSAVMEPYTYTASAWTTEPSELIVVDGERLRELCETNRHVGYEVVKGIGEVISRRFGQAMGEYGDLREKDLRALSGEERVVWDNGELQLTTRAVLIGMAGDSPDVIPLEAVYSAEAQGDCVLFHVHGGDVCSPPLEDPAHLAALVEDEVRRTRYAGRRKGYYGSGR